MGTEKELVKLERDLVFDYFTNDMAFRLAEIIVNITNTKYERPVALSIEKNNQPILLHLMDGTEKYNALWLKRKKNVVDLFGHSSQLVAEQQGNELDGLLDLNTYQAVGGSFPIIINKTGMIGTVTVGGLTGKEDHELCVAALKQLKEEIK